MKRGALVKYVTVTQDVDGIQNVGPAKLASSPGSTVILVRISRIHVHRASARVARNALMELKCKRSIAWPERTYNAGIQGPLAIGVIKQ